jgi:peroxiredoxin
MSGIRWSATGALIVGLIGPASWGVAQQPQARPGEAAKAVGGRAAIEAEFEEGLRKLERERVAKLAALAGTQQGAEAEETYEALFRFALSTENFKEAEPAAEHILGTTGHETVVHYLASVVNLMAEAKRGQYEESLQSLVAALREGNQEQLQAVALPVEARLSILEAYYQILMQANQLEVARKAFTLMGEAATQAGSPEVAAYTQNRLRQMALIGQVAPDFESANQDGKPFRLAELHGKVVLVVFWATWCIPSDQQAYWLEQVHARHQAEGFEIVSVNLDLHQEAGLTAEMIGPHLRRFLIDHNVTWPNVVDEPGAKSIAAAYGVSDIPSSVLIGADGKVIDIDLSRADAEREIVKALAGVATAPK